MDGDSWRECVKWMMRVGFLPSDHDLTDQSAKLSDLAYFLRDGVALCHLLNRISPGCLDRRKFCPLPESQFSSANNINTFQKCCCQIFQIPHSFQFDAKRFVRLENISDALRFLSELSKRTNHITTASPFFINTSIYYNLSCRSEMSYYRYDYISMEDDVYANVMNTFDRKVKKQGRSDNLLLCCVDELLDTEKNYISVLELIENKFLKPLKTVLEEKYFKLIFSEIKPLLRIHRSLYEELVDSTRDDCFLDVADVFIKFKEQFLTYGTYCKNLKSNLDLLEELKTGNNNFKERLKGCEEDFTSKRFKLHELLTIPMQRVLKYPLLLKEMMKLSTEKKAKSLEKAVEETQDLARYVNEVTRDNDIITQIGQLQNRMLGLPSVDLTCFGRTIKDGETRLKSLKSSKFKMRHLFLFDKILIICKPNSGNFTVRQMHDTKNMKTNEIRTLSKRGFRGFKSQYQCTIEIGSVDNGDLIISSKVKQEVASWWTAIKEAKDNVSPMYSNSPREFQLRSFNEVKICDVCKKLLRGLYCQGYYYAEENIASHKDCLILAQKINKGTFFPKPLRDINSSRSCTDLSYVNNDIERQPWYMGVMERDLAFKLLCLFPGSTFLVRKSSRQNDFCINVKYLEKIQNIKICHRNRKFFLSDIKKFSTIVELVSYYETHSLRQVFRQLKTHLAFPIKNAEPLGSSMFCRANNDVRLHKEGVLCFEKGDVILVVDRRSIGGRTCVGYLGGEMGEFDSTMVEFLE